MDLFIFAFYFGGRAQVSLYLVIMGQLFTQEAVIRFLTDQREQFL